MPDETGKDDFLNGRGKIALHGGLLRQITDVLWTQLVIEMNRPAERRLQIQQSPYQRGFSRTVLPQNAEALPLFQRNSDWYLT
jgi:hypothetical protein